MHRFVEKCKIKKRKRRKRKKKQKICLTFSYKNFFPILGCHAEGLATSAERMERNFQPFTECIKDRTCQPCPRCFDAILSLIFGQFGHVVATATLQSVPAVLATFDVPEWYRGSAFWTTEATNRSGIQFLIGTFMVASSLESKDKTTSPLNLWNKIVHTKFFWRICAIGLAWQSIPLGDDDFYNIVIDRLHHFFGIKPDSSTLRITSSAMGHLSAYSGKTRVNRTNTPKLKDVRTIANPDGTYTIEVELKNGTTLTPSVMKDIARYFETLILKSTFFDKMDCEGLTGFSQN